VGLIIREGDVKDIERVLFVYREAGLDTDGSLSIEAATEIINKMKQYPNYKMFVAVADGEVVGTFTLLIMDNLVHKGARSGIVEAVGVLPSFQGKGIGKEMMAYAMDRCKDNRCYKMMLSSNEKRTNAHRFYESLGFTRHGFSFKAEL
jgi:GNAT superfamily N-acetyltransferase